MTASASTNLVNIIHKMLAANIVMLHHLPTDDNKLLGKSM